MLGNGEGVEGRIRAAQSPVLHARTPCAHADASLRGRLLRENDGWPGGCLNGAEWQASCLLLPAVYCLHRLEQGLVRGDGSTGAGDARTWAQLENKNAPGRGRSSRREWMVPFHREPPRYRGRRVLRVSSEDLAIRSSNGHPRSLHERAGRIPDGCSGSRRPASARRSACSPHRP